MREALKLKIAQRAEKDPEFKAKVDKMIEEAKERKEQQNKTDE